MQNKRKAPTTQIERSKKRKINNNSSSSSSREETTTTNAVEEKGKEEEEEETTQWVENTHFAILQCLHRDSCQTRWMYGTHPVYKNNEITVFSPHGTFKQFFCPTREDLCRLSKKFSFLDFKFRWELDMHVINRAYSLLKRTKISLLLIFKKNTLKIKYIFKGKLDDNTPTSLNEWRFFFRENPDNLLYELPKIEEEKVDFIKSMHLELTKGECNSLIKYARRIPIFGSIGSEETLESIISIIKNEEMMIQENILPKYVRNEDALVNVLNFGNLGDFKFTSDIDLKLMWKKFLVLVKPITSIEEYQRYSKNIKIFMKENFKSQ